MVPLTTRVTTASYDPSEAHDRVSRVLRNAPLLGGSFERDLAASTAALLDARRQVLGFFAALSAEQRRAEAEWKQEEELTATTTE